VDLAAKFEEGLSYADFLAKYGTPEQQGKWAQYHATVKLKPAQLELLQSWKREMKVLVLAGAWCGDCVNQCPMFDHFAQAAPVIKLRFFDRDAHPDLGTLLSVCGGARVPVVLFASEDNFRVGMYGDRTLAKYRRLVADIDTGPSCPTGILLPGQSADDAVLQDWLDEFERVQWILRTSGRLRKLHND
jgi:thiol-disulfide isomerase/thioredoxin